MLQTLPLARILAYPRQRAHSKCVPAVSTAPLTANTNRTSFRTLVLARGKDDDKPSTELTKDIGPSALQQAAEPSAAVRPANPSPLLLTGVGAMLFVGIILLGPYLSDLTASLEERLSSQGPFTGPLLFVLAYVASALLLLPGSVLTLAAGYIYGPLQGTALVSAASTTAAATAFLMARYIARPLITSKLADNDTFRRIDAGIRNKGARLVLLLRLSPLIPFSLSNYLYGLTSVPFGQYVAASWVGMLPGTFAYVYLASVARVAVDTSAGAGSDETGVIRAVVYGVGAVATLAATKYIADLAASQVDESAQA